MKNIKIFALILALIFALTACGKTTIQQDWQEQFDLGVRFLNEDNYEEAIIAFEAAIKIEPKNPEAYIGLADVYIKQGDEEKAKEILEKGLESIPGNEEIIARIEEIESGTITSAFTTVKPEIIEAPVRMVNLNAVVDAIQENDYIYGGMFVDFNLDGVPEILKIKESMEDRLFDVYSIKSGGHICLGSIEVETAYDDDWNERYPLYLYYDNKNDRYFYINEYNFTEANHYPEEHPEIEYYWFAKLERYTFTNNTLKVDYPVESDGSANAVGYDNYIMCRDEWLSQYTKVKTIYCSRDWYYDDIDSETFEFDIKSAYVEAIEQSMEIREQLSIPIAPTDYITIKGAKYSVNRLELDLKDMGLTDDDIKELSKLKNLTKLNLTSNEITDISPLSDLTNLTELALGANDISDISPISNMTNLSTLILVNNEFTDVKPLSKLINLKHLLLNNNDITDISPLLQLSHLKDLEVEWTAVTENDIENFKKSLPKCRIYWNGVYW